MAEDKGNRIILIQENRGRNRGIIKGQSWLKGQSLEVLLRELWHGHSVLEAEGFLCSHARERGREGRNNGKLFPRLVGPLGDKAFNPLLLWNLLPPARWYTCPYMCPLPPDTRKETVAFSVAESQVAGGGK